MSKTRTAPVEPQAPKERKLLKPRKFREKYQMSETTLWRRLRDGSLAYVEIGPQKFIIEPDEVKRAARPE